MTASGERLASYDEIIGLLEAMPVLVREKRRRLDLTLRAAESASGVSFNVIAGLERGGRGPSWSTTIRLLRWLALPDEQSVSRSLPRTDGDLRND